MMYEKEDGSDGVSFKLVAVGAILTFLIKTLNYGFMLVIMTYNFWILVITSASLAAAAMLF